jgi:hypothetical protein
VEDAVNTAARLAYRLLSERRTIAIRDCVHYCGFRYGRHELNPYEQYAKALAAGVPPAERREAFVDFLRHYRPRDLGEALGVSVSRHAPLWRFPWARARRAGPAWVREPRDVVDVMTHFCERGIPSQLVEAEFSWHERAYASMAEVGYRPGPLSLARVQVLRGPQRDAYLVTDGNHRISALSALGVTTVDALCLRLCVVHRDHVERWPLVRAGHMSATDALAIFDAYHRGNSHPARSHAPAPLVSG